MPLTALSDDELPDAGVGTDRTPRDISERLLVVSAQRGDAEAYSVLVDRWIDNNNAALLRTEGAGRVS